ncbi:helix-turn-helix transcriptional regulator [Carnobacterium maltaromaticum]|uniref:helix-turn-helix transcriptional regulator n=1 Tax=Carnobacterium maltaromaticum TaxID=2751 RepID=UPI0039B0EC0B
MKKQLDLKKIKLLRNKKNISMQNAAESLGLKNASTYMKYENGEYSFKADALPTLSTLLDCEIEKFFK